MKKLLSILSVLIAAALVSACDSAPHWEATVYGGPSGAKQVIGTYETRAACEEASMMHFHKDKEKARMMMAQQGMSSSCSAVAK